MDVPMKNRATQLLMEDHLHVKELYVRFQQAEDPSDRLSLAEDLCKELEIHSRLEECLFYPELARDLPDEALVRHFGQQHGELRRLMSQWRLFQGEGGMPAAGEQLLLSKIMNTFQQHAAEEEDKGFPRLEAVPDRNDTLGSSLARLKLKLKMFPPIHRCVDLDVPVRTAYNQWTQFETFPRFLENVKEVRQLDEGHLQWQVEVAGKELQWVAEIYEQIPDQRIAWTSTGGTPNSGAVSFRSLSPSACRMLVELEYEPQGVLEDLGALVGLVPRRVERELQRFKAFVEGRKKETGAWRGEIQGSPVEPEL